MAIAPEPLIPGKIYHIYNRAVGSELLFREESDYAWFFAKWMKYIFPITDLYAYCLIPNHFHALVKIKPETELISAKGGLTDITPQKISLVFSRFFNSCARSYNLKYQRKGKLFMQSFKRKVIDDDCYFTQIVYYIHRNPVHHSLVNDVHLWEYSSYNEIAGQGTTILDREKILGWFGGRTNFKEYHQLFVREYLETIGT